LYNERLEIEGYGVFKEKTEIKFNKGLNVLIGANNSGKSTVMSALRILLDRKFKTRLDIADFSRVPDITCYQKSPPQVTIKLFLVEDGNKDTPYSDELVTVSNWLTRIDRPFEAQLTYRFYLPEKEIEAYQEEFKNCEDTSTFWKKLEHDFLRKYRHEFLVGNPKHNNKVNYDELYRFSFYFLDAIRDVERDMFKGSSSLLKEVIHFFLDYELKDEAIEEPEKIKKEVEKNQKQFQKLSSELIRNVKERMKSGREEIFKYSTKMGAHKDEEERLELDGSLSEVELYSALRLIIKKKIGINLPVTHNGLGYNNLIFISLLLAKMQKDNDANYLGDNASIFSVLAVEEPEAHLHPNMQYKFLKYLSEEQNEEVNQIFITTHSPNITAAIDLDSIIVLQQDVNDNIHVAYPGAVFDMKKPDDIKSKKYVQRFLDVTKADMLFADKIMFVEGVTEQMIIPAFARKLDYPLEDHFISIINLGGRYFSHFLKLFNSDNKNAIRKKVAFITDRDPMRKKKKSGAQEEKCPVILLNRDNEKYLYEDFSNPMWKEHRILFDDREFKTRGFIQSEDSATLEDALIYVNPTNIELIVESMSNKKELEELMNSFDDNIEYIIDTLKGPSNFVKEVKEMTESLIDEKPDKRKSLKKQIISHRYLMSVNKGEAAQELASVILENNKDSKIQVPQYIEEAIKWLIKS